MSLEPEDFAITTQQSRDALSEKELTDYQSHRLEFIRWLLHLGKDPEMAEGYSRDTVEKTAYRTDQFYRWVWEQDGGYTTTLTHDHADDFMTELLYTDTSATHKSNTQKALQRYFKWVSHENNGDEWEPERSFNNSSGGSGPREYLTIEERKKIREAALKYGSIPHYSSLSPRSEIAGRGTLLNASENPSPR